jgi:hypothetical protein
MNFDASTEVNLALTGHVLAEINRRASESDATVMVIGAAARDILIRHVVGSEPNVTTRSKALSWDTAGASHPRRRRVIGFTLRTEVGRRLQIRTAMHRSWAARSRFRRFRSAAPQRLTGPRIGR